MSFVCAFRRFRTFHWERICGVGMTKCHSEKVCLSFRNRTPTECRMPVNGAVCGLLWCKTRPNARQNMAFRSGDGRILDPLQPSSCPEMAAFSTSKGRFCHFSRPCFVHICGLSKANLLCFRLLWLHTSPCDISIRQTFVAE